MDWPYHWLLNKDHRVFRGAVESVVMEATKGLIDPDARDSLGGKDTQCQHFFTKVFTLFRTYEADLTRALLCCSRLQDPVIEMRYYRSVPRRSSRRGGPQLVESETGADFALTLEVAVPGEIAADRSVLGQAKLVDLYSVPIPASQLEKLLGFAGPESGVYMMWGPNQQPSMVTAQNIRTLARVNGSNRLRSQVASYGKPFAEFLVDMFFGLWFGKDFVRAAIPKRIPKNSPTALFAMLHLGTPPPNVVHFGITSSKARDLPAGVHVQEIIELNGNERESR